MMMGKNCMNKSLFDLTLCHIWDYVLTFFSLLFDSYSNHICHFQYRYYYWNLFQLLLIMIDLIFILLLNIFKEYFIFKWSYGIDQYTSFLICMDSRRDAWTTFAMLVSLYTCTRKLHLILFVVFAQFFFENHAFLLMRTRALQFMFMIIVLISS